MTVLEGFEKHFNGLANVQVRIQLKIKHVTGCYIGVSSYNSLLLVLVLPDHTRFLISKTCFGRC